MDSGPTGKSLNLRSGSYRAAMLRQGVTASWQPARSGAAALRTVPCMTQEVDGCRSSRSGMLFSLRAYLLGNLQVLCGIACGLPLVTRICAHSETVQLMLACTLLCHRTRTP